MAYIEPTILAKKPRTEMPVGEGDMTPLRPLILVSNPISHQVAESRVLQPDCAAPRLDYLELRRLLGADLLGISAEHGMWADAVRRIQKSMRLDVVSALNTVLSSKRYAAYISLSEKVAIPLAMLTRGRAQRPPHIVVAHKLSSGGKRHLFQRLHLHQEFDHIITVSRAQAKYAVDVLGMRPDQVDWVRDKVDHQFFCPELGRNGDFILAVGQEQRDYETLIEAVRGTGIRLVIVASSPWSTGKRAIAPAENVTWLQNISYCQLRELYAEARLVVVPLFDVDYAAGANALLEAMAMAKAMVVTQTTGIDGYLEDGVTGHYTLPGDIVALRARIFALWENPVERARLGVNARQLVDNDLNIDCYVRRLATIIEAAVENRQRVE